MANEIKNGQAEYGTVHVMEEEMRAAEQGVFEAKSGDIRRKKAVAPADKTAAESRTISAATVKAPVRKVTVGKAKK